MNRRNFIKTTGLSLAAALLYDPLFASSGLAKNQLITLPDEVYAVYNNKTVQLTGISKELVGYDEILVFFENTGTGVSVSIQAPHIALDSITLRWKLPIKSTSKVLNDHWERSYGDLGWKNAKEMEILPWYFMEYNKSGTSGFGVKTGANAFCYWVIYDGKLNLTLDTRSGGNGVQLLSRKLKAAEIVSIKSDSGESPFQTARRFTKLMCDKPRMPKQPVYGINDWYFSYGNTSADLIFDHTQRMAPMADGLSNRPFSVIDSGWFVGPPDNPDDCCWGDMSKPEESFKDMYGVASKIKNIGMRPGIWTRPLCGSVDDNVSLLLPNYNGNDKRRPVLDPSIPENLERIKSYIKLYKEWGFELVKFDYTSFDIFKRFGAEMIKSGSVPAQNWTMYNVNKTNAEIVLNLYKAIREAAGDTYIIGCNTFSHLSAGLFELNRIGDDTSGQDWSRTKKMGVNTLAFRGIQHGNFYSADADCVGLTDKIPWSKNKQWMELLAKSGTPLFISAQPGVAGADQKEFIKKCFSLASQNLPLGEPLDWMETPTPKKWKLNNEVETFNWD